MINAVISITEGLYESQTFFEEYRISLVVLTIDCNGAKIGLV